MKTLHVPLFRALSVMRPSGSKEEAQFRAWLATTYPDLERIDEAGNLHFKIGESETIFAAHTDTYHHKGGENNFLIEGGFIRANEDCLGADDGAGIAILCHMMSHRIPGRYIFTTGEEVGGLGARYLEENFDFTPYKRSVCFDRAGTQEIITVQGGERLASSEFAEALSEAFQEQDMMYVEYVNGVFTDNALWGEKLAENINLSAGYARQHGPNEFQDLTHLEALAAAVIKIDWEALPTCREPGFDFGPCEDLVFAAIDKEWQEACVKASRGDFKFFQEQGFRIKDLRLVDEWDMLSFSKAWEIEQYLDETLIEET